MAHSGPIGSARPHSRRICNSLHLFIFVCVRDISTSHEPRQTRGQLHMSSLQIALAGQDLPAHHHLPASSKSWTGPPALDLSQLFIKHAQPGKGISTTSSFTITSRITVRELIDRLRLGAVSRWYLLYGGKILEPDALIPAHLRERTLDLVGTLNGGSDRGSASAGDDPADDADDNNVNMNNDADLDGTSPGNDSPADDLSDIKRAKAWDGAKTYDVKDV